MDLRPYDSGRDGAALWGCKAAFERELGALGGDAKATTYEGKLTDAYRERYLDWVAWCVERDGGCVIVAAHDGRDGTGDDEGDGGQLAGYAFVLPEALAMIWDAAVLNELYVCESHRGTGLADDLLEAALDRVRGQDLPVERIVLDVGSDNERAGAVYERHGFEPWARMLVREL
jgi:GNAT superfamily N-acetyltransferase